MSIYAGLKMAVFNMNMRMPGSDAEVRQEKIVVKGQAPVIEEVVVTRHGPIINSLWVEGQPEQPLALRWTALEPAPYDAGLV